MKKVKNDTEKEGSANYMSKTDLEAVKSLAYDLLYTDIQLTDYAPMIVQHPFTNTAIVAILEEAGKGCKLLNLLDKSTALEIWRKSVAKQIDRSNDIWGIYFMLNKPYSLIFVELAWKYLSEEDYSRVLSDAWVREESPNMNSTLNKAKLVKMFQRADRQFLMKENEREVLDRMGNTIRVYRGVTDYNRKNIRALSWTTDKSVAEWFAKRFGEKGRVYQADINRENVLAYFENRNEKEIVLNPAHLIRVTECA